MSQTPEATPYKLPERIWIGTASTSGGQQRIGMFGSVFKPTARRTAVDPVMTSEHPYMHDRVDTA